MTKGGEFRTAQGIKGGSLFKGEVPEEGYCWVDEIKDFSGNVIVGQWLTEIESGTQRIVLPYSQPEFLPSFIRLCKSFSAAKVKQFADKFGFLGHGVSHLHEGYKVFRPAETLEDWKQGTSNFYQLWEMWQLVKLEDTQELRKYVKWKGDSFYISLPHNYLTRSKKDLTRLSPSVSLRVGDLVTPMRIFIEIRVNERMKSHISPALFHFLKSDIYLVPDCLLSSLYLAFAFEVYGFMLERRPPKQCKHCKKAFTPDHGRRAYCSDNCKWVFNKRQQRISKSR